MAIPESDKRLFADLSARVNDMQGHVGYLRKQLEYTKQVSEAHGARIKELIREKWSLEKELERLYERHPGERAIGEAYKARRIVKIKAGKAKQ